MDSSSAHTKRVCWTGVDLPEKALLELRSRYVRMLSCFCLAHTLKRAAT